MSVNIEICNGFNAHAAEYEGVAQIQQDIGNCLFERLHYLKINPRYILDVGCGPGSFSKQLKALYPDAIVVGLDLAYVMLLQAKAKHGFWKKWPLINADMLALPFAPNLFDLVFANQVIHWSPDLSLVLGELNRVMNPGGCLMFSTLGPDTFCELKAAWASVDGYAHVNNFLDMHDVGDCVLAERFLDPVVDRDEQQVHYATLQHLLRALKSQGVRNINALRNKGLTGKAAWHAFEQAFACNPQGQFTLTYEVIYGHAWKGEQRRIGEGVETMVPVSALRRQR